MTQPGSKTLPAPTADDPKRRLAVGPKLRVAIDAMVFEGLDFADAAAKAGCTARAVRKAFERPHVLRYLRTRREVLRAQARAGNIRRLVQIRDAADNMPAVQAIDRIERPDADDMVEGTARRSPGVVIIVNGSNPPAAPTNAVDIRTIEPE